MSYSQRKEALREEAIAFQLDIQEKNLSWWEIYCYQENLYERAKKVGLVKEFKENGIL